MPKISIVVPVYNVENYLSMCIESLLTQTLADIEIILVDDGSKDRSGEICDEYALKDERVRVIHKINGGVSAARNTGLDMAKGEYVMFCDSDDYAEPTWCEAMLSHIVAHPDSWCFCGCNVVDANSKVFQQNCIFNHDGDDFETLSMEKYWDIYKTNYSALLWIRIFRLDLIRKNNIRFDEKMSLSEDVLFNLEYGKFCDKFAVVNLPLYNHRMYLNDEAEHLDGKLPKEMFYTNQRIYSARRPFIGVSNRTEFETDMFYRFIGDMKSIANDLSSDNSLKLRKIKEILHSNEFKQAFKNADTTKESKKFLLLLKLKVSKLVLIKIK